MGQEESAVRNYIQKHDMQATICKIPTTSTIIVARILSFVHTNAYLLVIKREKIAVADQLSINLQTTHSK